MAPRKKKAAAAAVASGERQYTITQQGPLGFLLGVSSNIKGGVDTSLGSCTAVVSPANRAGKTAVLDSIRYALTGEHPIGAHYADLCGLTADGSAPWAKLRNATSEQVVSHIPGGKKSVAHEDGLGLTDSQRAGLLPLSSIRDLLTMGTAKAREELFRRFGAGPNLSVVPSELDDEQVVLWQKALAASHASDPAEKLAAAGEWIRKEKRRISTEIKSLEGEKDRLLENSDFDPADEIKALQDKLKAAELADKHAGLLARRAKLHQELSDAINAFAALPKPLTEEEFHDNPALVATKLATELALKGAREASAACIEASNGLDMAKQVLTLRQALEGGCVVCGQGEPANIAALVESAKQYVAAMEAKMQPLRLAREQAEAAYVNAKNHETSESVRLQVEWRNSIREYEAQQERLTRMGQEYKQLEATLAAVGVTDSPADEATQREWMQEIADLQEQAAARKRTADVRRQMRELARLQEDVKTVESVIGDTLNDMVAGVSQKAAAAVNKWMPEGFTAALRLEDTEGKPVCRWEVVGSDGASHPRGAASGAEWAALTVALACAWTEGLPYRFLLLDDADLTGFSAANVRNVLDTVRKAVQAGELTQAFVAWSRPEEVPEEGWTVVSL